MIRDTRKDARYFRKYLEYQNKRIDDFRRKAESVSEDFQLGKLYLFISGFLHDKLYASYSNGCGAKELKSIYEEWLTACEKAASVCYSDLIDLASLCVLLESTKEFGGRVSFLIKNCGESDELLRLLQDALNDGKHEVSGGVSRYDAYAGLHGILTSTDKAQQAELLRDYVSDIWYPANGDSAWHDSHLSKQENYVGYWCFIGAAIVKIFGLDSGMFRSVEFYPSDLV